MLALQAWRCSRPGTEPSRAEGPPGGRGEFSSTAQPSREPELTLPRQEGCCCDASNPPGILCLPPARRWVTELSQALSRDTPGPAEASQAISANLSRLSAALASAPHCPQPCQILPGDPRTTAGAEHPPWSTGHPSPASSRNAGSPGLYPAGSSLPRSSAGSHPPELGSEGIRHSGQRALAPCRGS